MDKVKFEKTKAHQTYKTPDGVKVPGVTTVLGATIPKPALLAWAWKLGTEGIDFRKSRDQAADIGTIAHWLVECHLLGKDPDTSTFAPDDLSKAENSVIKFMSWWDTSKFELIASEKQLVADIEPFFGGTLDILAKDDAGKICLIDLKSGKGIYPEMWYQLSAYAKLYECNRGSSGEHLSRYIICRIGKEASEGDFEVQERQDLGREWNVFEKCLALYQALKQAKRPV